MNYSVMCWARPFTVVWEAFRKHVKTWATWNGASKAKLASGINVEASGAAGTVLVFEASALQRCKRARPWG